MQLISNTINEQLNALIGQCFSMNRMLDRGMSLLKVRWKMPRTSDILHEEVAHAYPAEKFADGISDYQASRGNETIYPATPIGNKNYDTPLEFFKEYFQENIKLENMIKDVMDMAEEQGDYTTKVFLESLLNNLAPFTDLSQSLIDIFERDNSGMYLQMIDSNIKKYVNL